jgi:hypothetical protein
MAASDANQFSEYKRCAGVDMTGSRRSTESHHATDHHLQSSTAHLIHSRTSPGCPGWPALTHHRQPHPQHYRPPPKLSRPTAHHPPTHPIQQNLPVPKYTPRPTLVHAIHETRLPTTTTLSHYSRPPTTPTIYQHSNTLPRPQSTSHYPHPLPTTTHSPTPSTPAPTILTQSTQSTPAAHPPHHQPTQPPPTHDTPTSPTTPPTRRPSADHHTHAHHSPTMCLNIQIDSASPTPRDWDAPATGLARITAPAPSRAASHRTHTWAAPPGRPPYAVGGHQPTPHKPDHAQPPPPAAVAPTAPSTPTPARSHARAHASPTPPPAPTRETPHKTEKTPQTNPGLETGESPPTHTLLVPAWSPFLWVANRRFCENNGVS